MGCFSGCLMSSAGIQELFCGIYSAFKSSFDEFVGEKVFSPSYSFAIFPGIYLEGMMLKLKVQYFGYLMQRIDSLEKSLMLGGISGRRRRG